jgi:hypothetical protein
MSGFKLGKGRGMRPEELHSFLTETKIFVKVGTIGEDGWPNVNPAWYKPERISSWDGGGVDRTFSKPARWHDVEAGQSLEDAVRT